MLTDVSPLSLFSKLRELKLVNCSLQDLSPLSSLTALEVLDLTLNPIKDISPLSQMTELRELYLTAYYHTGSAELADYALISTFDKLQRLELSTADAFDAKMLQPLSRLTYLRISAPTIENLAALSGISGLTETGLKHCRRKPPPLICHRWQCSTSAPMASLTFQPCRRSPVWRPST